ncbi:MAG: GreA/GreB family elongation factor [Bacilli bacterium]|nr:GreA/GreB family elongation factor [Bacilli bacterium]
MAKKKLEELTVTGFEELQARYRQLNDVDRVKNQEDVALARAQGDLSENADYDAACKKQAEIEEEIKRIEATKQNCVVLLTKEVEKQLSEEAATLSKTETIETSARLEALLFILDHKKFIDAESISIGSVVVYRDLRRNVEKKIQIVGTVEANPVEGKVSNISPLGTALYKKSVGDVVSVKAPQGDYQVEVISFEVAK